MTVVAKNITVLQLFISRTPKMCAIPQLVSAPLNPIPTVEQKTNLVQPWSGEHTILHKSISTLKINSGCLDCPLPNPKHC